MASVKPVSLTINTFDLDGDKIPDRVSFTITQKEQSFSLETTVDYAKDGFGNPAKATQDFYTPTPQSTQSKTAVNQAQKDKKVAENDGTLKALQQMNARVIGGHGLGGEVSNNIGGLIGQVGTQYGSGGLGARGDGWGGGGNAEVIGGLGTRGAGLGGSGYGRGAGFYGLKGDSNPIMIGTVDHSLEDRVIKQHLAEIRYAYESVLSSNPDLKGKVVIRFTIAKDGTVSEATVRSSEWNHDEAGKNVAEKICDRFLRMKFSAPKGGGITILSYPFEFPGE